MNIGLSDKTNYKYEYELFEPIAIHIQIAAEQLVIGMYKSISHQGQAVETLAMMLKRKNRLWNIRWARKAGAYVLYNRIFV